MIHKSFIKDAPQLAVIIALRLQIQFRSDGPLGGILAMADTKGQVKGKVGNPEADPPLRADGKLAVGAAVGQGQLCVTRSHPGQPRPFTGVVSIVSGEIAEDLATYLVSMGLL